MGKFSKKQKITNKNNVLSFILKKKLIKSFWVNKVNKHEWRKTSILLNSSGQRSLKLYELVTTFNTSLHLNQQRSSRLTSFSDSCLKRTFCVNIQLECSISKLILYFQTKPKVFQIRYLINWKYILCFFSKL